MIQENEIVMLVLALGVGAFLLADRVLMRRIPSFRLLAAGFGFLVGAFVFTVVEGFFLHDVFNLLEHASYAASALCVAFWCRRVFGSGAAGVARGDGEKSRDNGDAARCR